MPRRLSTFRPVAQGSSAQSSSDRRRGGFSMIELLIVITVIAILVSLLLVGVQAAVSRARVATVVSEIKNLEQAIKSFRAEFGVDPPSSLILWETATAWSSPPAAYASQTRASRSIIRQLWKDYDFGTNVDINKDNTVSNATTPLLLNGAECLVFFLGGVVDRSGTVITPKGFSKVPSYPFTSLTGARSGPFYEFKSNQFVDLDGDGFAEYLDSIPGQSNPIQYLSSYDGAGYRPYGLNNTLDNSYASDDEVLPSSLRWVYTKTAGSSSTSKAAEPFNPNTFQLISPGLDSSYCGQNTSSGLYEGGGFLDVEKGVQIGPTFVSLIPTPSGTTITRDATSATQERDNITNFTGGEIH